MAKAADFVVDDDVDIDSVDAMRQAFLDETIKESKVTLFDTKTGKKLESAAAWASYDPRNASRMHVGYFIPDAEQETAAGQPDTLELCGFTKSENCKNEQPTHAMKQTRRHSRTRSNAELTTRPDQIQVLCAQKLGLQLKRTAIWHTKAT